MREKGEPRIPLTIVDSDETKGAIMIIFQIESGKGDGFTPFFT